MGLLKRPIYVGHVAAVGLATVAMTGAFAVSAAAAAKPSPQFVTLRNSVAATTDHRTGGYRAARMSVELTLAPRNGSGLASELRSAYTKGSSGYHKWLAKGQFDARYAPTAAERAAVVRYLRSAGLQVTRSSSPFLVRAAGSSQRIAAAFRTSLSSYVSRQGTRYFSNSTGVRLPAGIAPDVLGIVGLTNTVRMHSMAARVNNPQRPMGKATSSSSTASCETGYVTTAELFNAVNNGVGFPYGYGGGPGCSGLTPSQVNSIYGAPHVGSRGKGAGVTLGVFELSWYQASDIATWAHQFYGGGYTPPLTNEVVDGGPLAPVCPSGDMCPANFNGYAGDVEVDADIEVSLAVAPDVRSVEVYNAPNDFTGQTELDEYTAIANQDTADTVSSSWAVCENDVSSGYVQAENQVFEQMALQGQSLFGAEGDTGAFSCIRSDGTTVLNVLDPPSQPWMTSVGGTSLESYNPGTRSNPGPAPSGTETVWNTDSLCNASANEGGTALNPDPGFFWCAATGSTGGGFSQWWGRPFYQFGRGVNNPAFPSAAGTPNANGITECALASAGTPCREDPDVSAMADPYNGYAEYCTANAGTPFSGCGFSAGQLVPGWFGIGGTSLSSPLWAAIIADRDGFQHVRTGNINPLVYLLFNLDPHRFFNDITGIGPRQQAALNNGLYPTTPGYDMSTGVGSPRISAWITGF
jgi:subtilase family serine protease